MIIVPLKHFFMSLREAKQIMTYLISRNNSKDWYDEENSLDYVSIVECSHYEPYREYQVVEYRGF